MAKNKVSMNDIVNKELIKSISKLQKKLQDQGESKSKISVLERSLLNFLTIVEKMYNRRKVISKEIVLQHKLVNKKVLVMGELKLRSHRLEQHLFVMYKNKDDVRLLFILPEDRLLKKDHRCLTFILKEKFDDLTPLYGGYIRVNFTSNLFRKELRVYGSSVYGDPDYSEVVEILKRCGYDAVSSHKDFYPKHLSEEKE